MAGIKGGFSFDGVDIADIGLTYAPEIGNIYVYKPAAYKLHEQAFDAHDGGYYYGNTMQPKDFSLRCIFEEQSVLDGVMTRIDWLFKRGRTGRLVFAKRPWLWYTATVVGVNTTGLTNRENGVIVVQMRAYYPYARSDQYYTDREYTEKQLEAMQGTQLEDALEKNRVIRDIRANSAIAYAPLIQPSEDLHNNGRLNSNNQVAYDFTFGNTDATHFMTENLERFPVINPGTERAAVCVEVGGTFSKGLTITNHTNSQVCRFVGGVSDRAQYIQCDALNGRVSRHGSNGDVTLDYLYHDYGFMYLEPAGLPLYRSNGEIELQSSGTGESSFTLSDGVTLPVSPNGYWIYDENKGDLWQIGSMIGSKIFVKNNPYARSLNDSFSITEWMIIRANEISIKKGNDGNMRLHRMRFVFKPTFS